MNADYMMDKNMDTTSNNNVTTTYIQNNKNQSKIENVKDSTYFQNTDTIFVKTPPRTIILP